MDNELIIDTKEAIITVVTIEVMREFATFGGGQNPVVGSPLSFALKDHPPQFAGGVDVEKVVRMVTERVLYLSS